MPDTLSHGKKSIVIDLKKKEGDGSYQTIIDMLGKIDVVLESYRPGVMEKLKLGPQDVWEHNPNIIYGRLTGFGSQGKLALLAGHDMTYLAYADVMKYFRRYRQNDDLDNVQKDKPVIPWNLMADFLGGSYYLFSQVLDRLAKQKLGYRSKDPNFNVIEASMMHTSKKLFQSDVNCKS